MGKLTFQAALGGTVDLVGPNTASTVTLNLPATSGDIVGTGSTGVITTGMISGQVAVAQGGTGSATAQTAINTLAGAVTSGSYLRGNGTNVVMSTIQGADVPTLNQNTTGTAAGLSSILAVASGGTGTSTPALVAGTNVTITGTWPNQTINSTGGGSGMVYPGAGIPLSTGTAWGTSYATSGASSVVLRDANSNIVANNTLLGYTTIVVATSTNTSLSVGSTFFQRFIGGTVTGATINLPDATTLSLGHTFVFSNDSTSNIILYDNNNVSTGLITPGMTIYVFCKANTSAAGTWGRNVFVPGTSSSGVVYWGTSGLVMPGQSIDSLTTISMSGQLTNTVATGTAPFVISSTTPVANLSIGGNAATATNVAYSGLTGTVPTWNQNTTGTAANVTGTVAVANGGTGVTTSTGTGAVVLSTSPTLVTPLLGTPTSGNFSTGTFTWPTFNQNTTGTAAGLSATLAIASGGTNTTATPTAGGITYGTGTAQAYSAVGTAGQVLTSNGASAPTWSTVAGLGTVTSVAATVPAFLSISGSPITTNGTLAISYSGTALPVANGGTGTTTGSLVNCTVDGTNAVGYLNVPQNAQTGAYTLVLADGGKHIYHASGAAAATYTIPAASSVAFPIGTVISFVNLATAAVTISITTDTMYLTGTGTTGSRTLAQYGIATATKVSGLSSAGIWVISGAGLT